MLIIYINFVLKYEIKKGVLMEILLKKVRLIEPYLNIDQVTDIFIKDGIIKEIGENINSHSNTILGENLLVTNGFLDLHVHLRDPGFKHKEDIITGTKSAAVGGFTGVCPMPNTFPITDNIDIVNYIREKSEKDGFCTIYPSAAITKMEMGKEFTDFSALIKAGVVAFSDDGGPVEDDEMMKKALILARDNNTLIMSHCEDLKIVDGGIMHKGEVSKQLGIRGIDRLSEDTITQREINLAQEVGAKIHICHVSTRGSLEAIRQGKKNGVMVTAETCPHYFSFTDEMLRKKDADYRMNPPLRENDDVNAVIEAIKDGTIDAITTDHAPHSKEEKVDFLKAPNGVIGLETSFSASYTNLVRAGHIGLDKLIGLYTKNPYKIIGEKQNEIRVGQPANLTVIDLDKKWTVDVEKLYSKSKNAIFKGEKLHSKVILTMNNGKITYDENDNIS